jgi:peptidoglycan/LPS O-acetylase OafA/YrhL
MKKDMPFLDILRAIAVLGVVVVHTVGFTLQALIAESVGGSAENALIVLLSAGRLGVEVFFLLSGFLLASIYENQTKSSKAYFLARFLRIWPLWMLFSLIWAMTYLIEGRDLAWVVTGLLLSSVFLLWASPEHWQFFIGGAWSIQIEVIAYAIFWFFRGKKTSLIISIAISVNLLGMLLAVIADLESPGVLESLRRLSFQTGFNFFVLGWLAARVFAKDTPSGSKSNSLDFGAIKSQLQSSFGVGLLGLWIISFLLTPAYYGNPIEALGFALLSIGISTLINGRLILRKIFVRIGKLSFFMFFSHFVILHFLFKHVSIEILPTSLFESMVLTALVTVSIVFVSALFGEISMRLFEKPLMNLSKKQK